MKITCKVLTHLLGNKCRADVQIHTHINLKPNFVIQSSIRWETFIGEYTIIDIEWIRDYVNTNCIISQRND